MMRRIKFALFVIALAIIAVFLYKLNFEAKPKTDGAADYTITFPSDKYPETGKHISDAIKAGESPICTIDRKNAGAHRDQSLKGVPTKKGFDRDEWPMAMCAEGGTGADIRYVTPADNRGAGSWIANQIDKLPDGTRVKVVVPQ